MRLQAKEELQYAGRTYGPGMLFDALERDGLLMINQDQAVRFNLEDPSTRTLADIVDNLKTVESVPPGPLSPVSLLPTSTQVTADGGTQTFNVVPTGDGSWTASTVDPWLHIDSPTTPQMSPGTVTYSIQAHNGTVGEPAADRTGVIQVNDAAFAVTQTPWDVLPVELDPKEAITDANGGPGSFNVTITGSGASGTWTVDIENAARGWLTVDSPTTPESVDGPVMYSVWANTGAERTGKFFVNGQPFTVTQAA